MTIRNFSRYFLPLALAAFVAVAANTAKAQVSVDATDFWNSDNSAVDGYFDASGSDKLVVIVTGENGNPGSPAGICTSVTYDGVEMTELIQRLPIAYVEGPPEVPWDQTYNAIFYLDNPATSTGLISPTVNSRGNVTVFGLSGTAEGPGNAVISPRDTNFVDLTTTADSIVIASYGLGGNGNTATLGDVTTDLPLTEVSRQENGNNWDGHVTAYATEVAAGSATYSFTDASPAGGHVIAAEFLMGAPQPRLALQVNPFNGVTTMFGDMGAFTINYYEVTSEGGSLDPAGWNSLADQDFENGGGNSGTGDGWEEAGGVDTEVLAEGYLKGNSTISSNASIDLGKAYDVAVDAQDLVLWYRTSDDRIVRGRVKYDLLNPDIDGNGSVDSADLNLILSDYHEPVEPEADGAAPYSPDELAIVLNHFGWTSSGAPGAEVPEPTAMVLLLLGAFGLTGLRRRR